MTEIPATTGESVPLARDWFLDAARRMQQADYQRSMQRVGRILAAQEAIPVGLRDHPAAIAVLGAVASDYPPSPRLRQAASRQLRGGASGVHWQPGRPMMLDRSKRYKVVVCASCAHPGGLHAGENDGYPCTVCDCSAWVEGDKGWWSHGQTDSARAARAAFADPEVRAQMEAAVERTRTTEPVPDVDFPQAFTGRTTTP